MAVEDSILKSTKKNLGLTDVYDDFDQDVITHINTCFIRLKQLGIGPPGGFMIEDADAIWDEFTSGEVDLNPIKTYISLKVRSYFDPPGTPHHLSALKEQVAELEQTLLTEREVTK